MENIKNIPTIKTKILAAAIYLCCTLPAAGQTELYKQYRHLKDVTVACIMNFHVNDTTQVELTILAPQTKEAVYYLVEEFNLGIEKDIIDKTFGDVFGDENNSKLSRRIVHKNDAKKAFGKITSADYKDISELVYKWSTGTIVVFHNIENIERRLAINSFLTTILTEPEKFPTIDNVNN